MTCLSPGGCLCSLPTQRLQYCGEGCAVAPRLRLTAINSAPQEPKMAPQGV